MPNPLKKPNKSPESYSPKKEPVLLRRLAALQNEMADSAALPKAKTLDGIPPTDEPWVGACQYLLCFTSLYMQLEKQHTDYFTNPATRAECNGYYGFCDENSALTLLHRERFYKTFLTVTGMGLTNTWHSEGMPHDYEAAKGYIARSMRFAGYGYEIVENNGAAALMASIRRMVACEVPVLARYEDSWVLLIGYTADAVIIQKGEKQEKLRDYAEEIEYIVCVTETGLAQPTFETVAADIIETMESGGEGFGPQAYYDAIAYFSNDALFENADSELLALLKKRQVDGFFISHAEARGFSGMGFAWRFLNHYERDWGETLNQLGYYGDQHHQIAWGGTYACGAAENLRSRSVRETMIYVIYQMMENDRIICRLLKDFIGMDTPDALQPRNPQTGEEIQSAQLAEKEMTVAQIQEQLQAKTVTEIRWEKDLMPLERRSQKIKGGALVLRSGKEEECSVQTAQKFTLPLKIDLRAKTDSTNIHLYYHRGSALLEGWRHIPRELRVADIATGVDLGYPEKGCVKAGEYMDISWILHRDFMALLVDGELRHCAQGYAYMQLNVPAESIRFGAAKGSTVTAEKLTITELE